MRCQTEYGQSIVLTALLFSGLALFGLYLVINADDWYNDTASTRQALIRAARDGATESDLNKSLNLAPINSPTGPLPTIPASLHCLDPIKAETTIRASLEQNLKRSGGQYVKEDGSPLTPAEIAGDTTGTYLIELVVVNPPALGCPSSDPLPTYPPGVHYDFTAPYIHIAARLPMQALQGHFQVAPAYVIAVTSATDPKGGQ